jgi:hypothetical protein
VKHTVRPDNDIYEKWSHHTRAEGNRDWIFLLLFSCTVNEALLGGSGTTIRHNTQTYTYHTKYDTTLKQSAAHQATQTIKDKLSHNAFTSEIDKSWLVSRRGIVTSKPNELLFCNVIWAFLWEASTRTHLLTCLLQLLVSRSRLLFSTLEAEYSNRRFWRKRWLPGSNSVKFWVMPAFGRKIPPPSSRSKKKPKSNSAKAGGRFLTYTSILTVQVICSSETSTVSELRVVNTQYTVLFIAIVVCGKNPEFSLVLLNGNEVNLRSW